MMEEHNPINILIASDINYAPYYGVMLTSLFLNNGESSFDIYLITDKTWTNVETRRFEHLCAKYQSRFYVLVVDVEQMRDFPRSAHINQATYYNLNAANLLPASVHKVIYLDGDMVVNGDLRPLWELDLKGNACAMAPNCTYFDQSYYDRLGYDNKYGYYNNGTTVYDLDYLRKIKFPEKALRLIAEHPDKMIWMDQDAQNALLYGKIEPLSFEYNFQTLFLSKYKWETYTDSYKQDISVAAEHPIVIHYNGWLKPWHYQYYLMPYGRLWNRVCQHSMWRNAKIRKPIVEYGKHLLKRIIRRGELMQFRNKEFIEDSLRLS